MTPDGGTRRIEDAARDRRDPARVLHYMRRRLLAALATSAVVVLLPAVARADDRCDARVADMRRRIDDFPARVVVPESAPQWLRSVASDLETETRERPVDRERARAALAAWAWPQALGACRDTFTKVVEGQTTRGIGYWSDDLVRALQAGVLACRCEGVDVDALELFMPGRSVGSLMPRIWLQPSAMKNAATASFRRLTFKIVRSRAASLRRATQPWRR